MHTVLIIQKCNNSLVSISKGFQKESYIPMVLPKGIRRYYRTSNHIERVNKELKRRFHVIGIFPNEASVIRLIGSVLIEENIRSLSSRRTFKKESIEKVNKAEAPGKLIQIAREQEALLTA